MGGHEDLFQALGASRHNGDDTWRVTIEPKSFQVRAGSRKLEVVGIPRDFEEALDAALDVARAPVTRSDLPYLSIFLKPNASRTFSFRPDDLASQSQVLLSLASLQATTGLGSDQVQKCLADFRNTFGLRSATFTLEISDKGLEIIGIGAWSDYLKQAARRRAYKAPNAILVLANFNLTDDGKIADRTPTEVWSPSDNSLTTAEAELLTSDHGGIADALPKSVAQRAEEITTKVLPRPTFTPAQSSWKLAAPPIVPSVDAAPGFVESILKIWQFKRVLKEHELLIQKKKAKIVVTLADQYWTFASTGDERIDLLMMADIAQLSVADIQLSELDPAAIANVLVTHEGTASWITPGLGRDWDRFHLDFCEVLALFRYSADYVLRLITSSRTETALAAYASHLSEGNPYNRDFTPYDLYEAALAIGGHTETVFLVNERTREYWEGPLDLFVSAASRAHRVIGRWVVVSPDKKTYWQLGNWTPRPEEVENLVNEIQVSYQFPTTRVKVEKEFPQIATIAQEMGAWVPRVSR